MRLITIAALSLAICGCTSQAPAPDPRIAQMQDQISKLQRENVQLQGQIDSATKERDTCNAKFDRFTVLYDVGFLNNETKAWVIPVDVEPVAAPGKLGTYSHYDPKTQVETVHFKGKQAK